jgi:hypothetical protein
MAIAGVYQKVWTKEINNDSIVIDSSFNLTILSVIQISGTGSMTGALNSSGLPSTPITLPLGTTVTVTGDNGLILDGITIATTGVISIVGR